MIEFKDFDETQVKAYEGALNAIKTGKPFYRIGGYAGTGKTTIAKHIAIGSGLHFIGAAFMGKAASQLRLKGFAGSETLHSIMYEYSEQDDRFYKKSILNCQAIAIDEGSTVPPDLWADARSFKKFILVLGDPGQLEPIGDDAKLMHDPDIILEKIHRYEGSIAWFANHVRTSGNIPRMHNDEVQVKNKSKFMDDLFNDPPSVVLCGFNKTRVAINRQVRERKRFREAIVVGERLIGLKNNRDVGIFNGQMLDVLEVYGIGRDRKGEFTKAKVKMDDGRIRNMRLWHGHLHQEKQLDWKKFPDMAAVVDYGYGTTVHKFQGSEDEDVMVIDEQCDLWSPVRHRYTAYTRAQKRLRVYLD